MKDSSFYFYLIISLSTHLLVTLILVFTDLNIFSQAKTIQPSIRIDTIGLPELKKIQSQARKNKEKFVNLHKKSPLKKQPKINKKQEREKQISETKQEKKEQVSETNQKKGNKLSEGIEEGLIETEQIEAINIYTTLIIGKIKLNWNLPKYLSDENYFTQLEVKINDEGEVIYKEIITSSGNNIFDSEVLKAIESSTPFPPPPPSVKKLISDGIVFGLSSKN